MKPGPVNAGDIVSYEVNIKSSLADHFVQNNYYNILFNNMEVPYSGGYYYTRLYKEAIEIHQNNICYKKEEEALKISKTWYPA